MNAPDIDVPTQKVAIFIHGSGGGGWEWNAWIPVFEMAGWRCVANDLEPCKMGIAQTRFNDYLAQVENVREKPEHLVLIGASMGGILALKASESLHPNALVLVNSVGPAGIGSHAPKSHAKVVEWSKGALKETQDSMPDSDEATIQFAFHQWRDESGAVLDEISRGIPVNPPKAPTLIVLGSEDTDVPNSIGEEMVARFGADIKIYEGMSHVGPLLGKRASEVAADVLTWLEANIR